MRVVVSGATGLVGRAVVAALAERGDEVTALARDPEAATRKLGTDAVVWDPVTVPPPADTLSGADAVVHLAGEPVSQRWNSEVKRRILESREAGTRQLVTAIGALDASERPKTLVCASASGYYGPRGDEELTESATPGDDFLAQVCIAWEREAEAATAHDVRRVSLRTGVVLSADGGALAKLLPPFKLGLGGPVAGGRQWMPWIHLDDVVALYLRAIDDEGWSGGINASAPNPVRNADFSKALGRALHRPAIAPVPGPAVRLLFGEMASIITTGQRQIPAYATNADFAFAYPTLEPALSACVQG
ncbi:MAG: TIGR01777 family oxidoreductase [Baekduia sp.]